MPNPVEFVVNEEDADGIEWSVHLLRWRGQLDRVSLQAGGGFDYENGQLDAADCRALAAALIKAADALEATP